MQTHQQVISKYAWAKVYLNPSQGIPSCSAPGEEAITLALQGLSHGPVLSFSHLVVSNSWTVACQAPLCMRFPRQKYWSVLPFPSPGDFPTRDQIHISCTGRQILYHWATKEVPHGPLPSMRKKEWTKDKEQNSQQLCLHPKWTAKTYWQGQLHIDASSHVMTDCSCNQWCLDTTLIKKLSS